MLIHLLHFKAKRDLGSQGMVAVHQPGKYPQPILSISLGFKEPNVQLPYPCDTVSCLEGVQ